METITATYKQLSKVPTVVGAKLTKSGKNVSSQWTVRNLDKGKPTKFSYKYTVDDNFKTIAESEFGVDVTNEQLSAISPSEQLCAVIRDSSDAKDKKQFLEVWTAHSLAHSVDLKALDVHGDVYADSEFKSLEWSPDESYLVYIAEKKLKESEPFIKRKPVKDEDKKEAGDNAAAQGEKHKYRQDWGEQLGGKYFSVITIFTLKDESVAIMKGVPETYFPGQVKWSPDGKYLVGVAWETEPRRLGLIFCTNRPSYIFSLKLDGTYHQISAAGMSVRSPRFVADKLVWLQREAGGPHNACLQICAVRWPLDKQVKVTTLVDIIQDEVMTYNNKPFHGIYCLSFPSRCSASDRRLVLSTQQKTTINSYVLNLDSTQLVDISDSTFRGSLVILDILDDIIVASRSSLTHPSQLVMARLPQSGQEKDIVWQPISKAYELPAAIQNAVTDHLFLQHDNEDSFRKFNAIYFAPEGDKDAKFPLIIHPHGGPHSGFVDTYSFESAFFVSLGFACLLTNYRGSTGSGQKSVDFILKNIGTSDVIDCKMAADEAVKRYPMNAQNIVLYGGSHGGFLVAHLSGQYPDFFRSVVSRNPVTDVSSMFNSTDIPDWCVIEAGFDFTESGPASEEQLLALRRASPMSHVHKVRAPTALMLGSVDKRVPYYQGLEYYHRLKANGCITQVFLYDDNHSLSSTPVEMDNLINSVLWFKKYSKQV